MFFFFFAICWRDNVMSCNICVTVLCLIATFLLDASHWLSLPFYCFVVKQNRTLFGPEKVPPTCSKTCAWGIKKRVRRFLGVVQRWEKPQSPS